MYCLEDTIAAITTPPGEGGVAIVRISGKAAVQIGECIFSGRLSSYASHTLHFGRVLDGQGRVVDEALAVVMEKGRSYTGDETVEIQGHGGAVAREVLRVVLAAGARPALPGEFTYRAFVNGRMDLAQAEAVQTLIGAKGSMAAAAAQEQLSGRLSKMIRELSARVTEVLAVLEAWVDFPEEGLEFRSMEELRGDLCGVKSDMERLKATFHQGKLLSGVARVCLVGTPNVGKSSLLNALLRRERAIVTPLPGTTRDVIEDDLDLGGLALRVVDTAGIRKTDEVVERAGISRSLDALESADLVVLVLDASRPLEERDRELLSRLPRKRSVVVWNKADIALSPLEPLALPCVLTLSAKRGDGLEELTALLKSLCLEGRGVDRGEVLITSERHAEALGRAICDADRVACALSEGVSPEFLCLDLRACLGSLASIIGLDVTEEVLTSIFSKFCIGK